jgi:hypothetical protein
MLNSSTRTLAGLSAGVWYVGAIVLLLKAGDLWLQAVELRSDWFWLLFSVVIGLAAGMVKGHFIFSKSCRRNLDRIAGIPRPKIWQFFSPGFFVALALMIAAGTTLSRLADGNHLLLLSVAALDLAISVALLSSSVVFWQHGASDFRLKLGRHPGLLLALGVYTALALAYFFIMPIFEGPDEWTHTGHVQYMADGNGLPVMLPGRGIWGGQQPPLYYATGAILMQPFDLDGVADYEENRRNPHAAIGYALDPGNKNNYLHTQAEDFPYQGLSLAVHVLRLYSILLGGLALVVIYFTAYEFAASGLSRHFTSLWQARTTALPLAPLWFATFAALFVAVQPMYGFINATVANEPANIAMCVLAVGLAQRYVVRGPATTIWRAVGLGAALGLAALAKMTGLSAGLVAVIAFLQTAVAYRRQKRAAVRLWRDGFIIGSVFLLVSGWWYWRNYQLYGDFFQQGLYKIYFGVDPQPLSMADFLYHLSIGEVSFWATFGWLNVVAPEWVYTIFRVVSRVGVGGVGLFILVSVWRAAWPVRGRHGPETGEHSQADIRNSAIAVITHPLWLHVIFPMALAFSLTRLVATEGGLQGRQLLPALGSLAIVITWGWWVLLPPAARRAGLVFILAILLAVALWLPMGVVSREYIPPPILSPEELPGNLSRLDWRYNDEMKLLAVEIGADVVKPGERVPVTVYWQALKPMTTNYSVFAHLIGRAQQNVGQFNTYPALGLRPTTTLQPGDIVADTYPVLVNGGSEAPAVLRVNVGLFDFLEEGRPGIEAIGPDNVAVSPTTGSVKLVPVQWPAVTPTLDIEFPDSIRLIDANLDGCSTIVDRCVLSLVWQGEGVPTNDYTVFVQLWQNGQQMAGFDSPPLNGDYPTGQWAAGEVIIDPHRLDISGLPSGEYQLFAGLYDFATGERLAATVSGTPLPDYAVDLGAIILE